MRLKVSKNYCRTDEPVRFAEEYCRAFARKLGLPWRVSVKLVKGFGSCWSGIAVVEAFRERENLSPACLI